MVKAAKKDWKDSVAQIEAGKNIKLQQECLDKS